MPNSGRAGASRPFRRFAKDEEGATLVLWGVMFVMLFGLVAMSFDMGRIGVTRSELQSYADHVALAAAGELDGQPGARARATDAAEILITDFQTFGNGGQSLGGAADFTITFHFDLPPKVLGPTQFVASSDQDAKYVRVQVAEQTVDLTFARAFNALTGTTPVNNKANAFAVAGMSSFACDAVQLWFCKPSSAELDPVTGLPLAGTELNLRKGQMIHMIASPAKGQYGPGNWGFIEEAMFALNESGPCGGLTGTGPRLRCILGAAQFVGGCFNTDGIDTEPGLKKGITGVSINTRFDIYEGSMQDAADDPNYAPAPIVTKGIKPKGGGKCIKNNVEATDNTAAFGRDDCFLGASNTCRDGRFGDGDWDFAAYMHANYDTDDNDTTTTEYPTWYAGLTDPTRWEVYQEEVKAGAALPDTLTGPREEDGLPQCGQTPLAGGSLGDNGERRRVMLAAVVDCSPPLVVNGSARNVPVAGYIEFFLTEPVGNDPSVKGNQLNLWAEVIDVYQSGTFELTSVLRDVPQLLD